MGVVKVLAETETEKDWGTYFSTVFVLSSYCPAKIKLWHPQSRKQRNFGDFREGWPTDDVVIPVRNILRLYVVRMVIIPQLCYASLHEEEHHPNWFHVYVVHPVERPSSPQTTRRCRKRKERRERKKKTKGKNEKKGKKQKKQKERRRRATIRGSQSFWKSRPPMESVQRRFAFAPTAPKWKLWQPWKSNPPMGPSGTDKGIQSALCMSDWPNLWPLHRKTTRFECNLFRTE